MRFCRNPAPGFAWLWDFPSKKFGKVFISGGRWFVEANNNFFGQLPGHLFVRLAWRKGLRFAWYYQPDEQAVAEHLSWMWQKT